MQLPFFICPYLSCWNQFIFSCKRFRVVHTNALLSHVLIKNNVAAWIQDWITSYILKIEWQVISEIGLTSYLKIFAVDCS